jgi:rhodanese-related sulfurtransferase
MLQFFSNLTTNQRLATLACVLGVLAIAATPTRGGRVSLDSRELALLMEKGADRVTARTLADSIIQARADFRVIDVRAPSAFAAGPRIPSAENIPMSALADAGLARDEKILLVADDGTRAAQAWFLLKAQGFKGVSIVQGGLRAWSDDVLFPRVDGLVPAERARLEAVSAHFGGAPRSGVAAADAPLTPATGAARATVAAAPLPPAGGAKKPVPAKKKEGC